MRYVLNVIIQLLPVVFCDHTVFPSSVLWSYSYCQLCFIIIIASCVILSYSYCELCFMIIQLLRVVFYDHTVIASCILWSYSYCELYFMIIQLLRVVFCDHTVIASCETMTCHQNAQCSSRIEGIVCICKYGYKGNGENCQRKHDVMLLSFVFK